MGELDVAIAFNYNEKIDKYHECDWVVKYENNSWVHIFIFLVALGMILGRAF